MSSTDHDVDMNDAADSDDGQELLLGNEKKLVVVSLLADLVYTRKHV